MWSAPAACPTLDDVLTRVRAHMAAQHRADRHWDVQARVTREGSRFRLELRMQSAGLPPAQRTLDAVKCAALAEAAGLLIALALEPPRSRPASPPPTAAADDAAPGGGASPSGVSTTAALPARAERAGAVAPGAPSTAAEGRNTPLPAATTRAGSEAGTSEGLDLRFEVAFALRLLLGTLPQGYGFGVQPALALHLARWRLSAGLTLSPMVESDPIERSRAQLRSHAILGELAIGVDVAHSPFQIWPSLIAELGELTVASRRVSSPLEQSSSWTAAGVGLRAAWTAWAALRVTLDASVVAPLSRPRWLLRTERGAVPLYTAAPVCPRFSLGIAYVFD